MYNNVQNRIIWDCIIVGGGPSGIALAWYLSKSKDKKILLVDREQSIGGCHRVRRVNGLFTEHGPRVYADSYVAMMTVLEDMDLKFKNLFHPYSSGYTDPLEGIRKLSWKEILTFVIHFIIFIILPDHGKGYILNDFLTDNNFSSSAKDYLNRICLVFDGGDLSAYTLHKFLGTIDQNIFYNIYLPKLPNDVGLFRQIQKKLIKNNVTILLNTNIKSIQTENGKVISVTTKNDKDPINQQYLYGKQFILAIPPPAIVNIFKNSEKRVRDSLGDFKKFKKWSQDTAYSTYIPIMFYWKNKFKNIQTPKLDTTPWNIILVEMSRVMKMDSEYKTILSTCISMPDKLSQNGMTAHQYTETGLIEETWNQIKNILNLPTPDMSILSPGVYKNKITKKWETLDSAFFVTQENIRPMQPSIPNLKVVGIQNGFTDSAVTTYEAATDNVLKLLGIQNNYTVWSISRIVWLIVCIILIIIIYVKFRKNL